MTKKEFMAEWLKRREKFCKDEGMRPSEAAMTMAEAPKDGEKLWRKLRKTLKDYPSLEAWVKETNDSSK